jgi:hypothetical protein
VQGEEELRAGAVTYLCVLANEDVGEKIAGAVADEGGEQLAPTAPRGSRPSTARAVRSRPPSR